MFRSQTVEQWLKACGLTDFTLTALPGDASFRRYFRLAQGSMSHIVMDAPPTTENCAPFVAIANALRALGLMTPCIFYQDLQQGYLVLTDFGERQYLQELNDSNAEALYDIALTALATLQTCQHVNDWKIPIFTQEFMRKELELSKEWYLQRYLQKTLTFTQEKKLSACFDRLSAVCAKQPYVFMHRDFHSANLMVLPDQNIGILDFQDAFYGPITYDLVSLLRDCYIDWPNDWVISQVQNFREKISLSISDDEFLYWFDHMGMQRHLKALLTFSRKFCRDHNANYLQHIPRTLDYLHHVSGLYPEVSILREILCAE